LFIALLLGPTGLLAQSTPGSISGQLQTFTGEPVAGVRVRAVTAPELTAGGSPVAPLLIAVAQSDENGRYRLEDIPPGQYVVAAGWLESPTYYPGVLLAAHATVVNVAVGQAILKIDFPANTISIEPKRDVSENEIDTTGARSITMEWLLGVGAFCLYFLPTSLAVLQRHHQRGVIGVINLFLGWTIVGWLGAMIWAGIDRDASVESKGGEGSNA
jgi:hypothetical protein